MLRLLGLILLIASFWPEEEVSFALPLDTATTYATSYPGPWRQGQPALLMARGTGTNVNYVLEVDPATGAIPVDAAVSFSDPDVNYVDSVIVDYGSTPVTTGAWVQLVASLSAKVTRISLFDSCGETLELGVGASSFEARRYLIPPGGLDGQVVFTIPSGSRLSIRAVTGDCTTGRLIATFVGT